MEQAKFSVDQKKISSILASMQAICAKRTTLDATTSILFQTGHNELVLKSTDLELSLQCSYSLEVELKEASFLVPGKRLFDLTKEFEGAIEFEVGAKQLAVKSGNAHLSLNIKDADEFPPFPERIENLMEFKTDDLLNMIEKVAFVIPQSNANPALNGLLFEISPDEVRLTATDGHCLAQVVTKSYKLETPQAWLVPRRAIFELKKILDSSEDKNVFIGVCGKQLVFSGDSFNLFTKLLVDSFPEYQQIMNRDGFTQRKAPKANFIKALRRSTCLLSGQFIATEFNFDNDKLEVAIHNKEVGKLKEKLFLSEYSEGQMEIRFYAPYLLSGLQVLPSDHVLFWLQNKTRPIIFEAGDDEHRMIYLVMPVSPVNNE